MDYEWKVRLYYKEDVLPPKKPGGLAIETVHADDFSKDIEIAAAKARDDIGKIEIIRL